MEVAVALVWAGTVLVIALAVRPLAERLVAVAELRAAPPAAPAPVEPPSPPDDVVLMAHAESEPFAREQNMARVLELYGEVRPTQRSDADAWALVRARFRQEREDALTLG